MGISVFLVDDHRVLRDALRMMIENEPDMVVVGEAESGRTALGLVEQLMPDVVVMDIGMHDLNGIESTRQITATHSQVKVLALTMYSDKRYVLGMLEAGASGYVLKAGASEELILAIRAVARGKNYLSADVTDLVVHSYVGRQFPTEDSAHRVLGARECEVLQLLAEGKTSKQSAAVLHISVNTVETHRRNIMKKLGIRSIAGLTKYAIREGMTTLDV